jgi:two-component system sensor histidine kinase HydH
MPRAKNRTSIRPGKSGPKSTRRKKTSARQSNVDKQDLFEIAKSYVGFTPRDSELLASFHKHVAPHLDEIIDDFYERIEGQPAAMAVITGGKAQILRLKGTLRQWLDELLKGPHDPAFAEKQALIGTRHVQIGLDQAFTITGIYVFREHLNRIQSRAYPKRTSRGVATQRAVVRILDLVTVLILDTYREDYARKILLAEQNARMRRLASLGSVATSVAHEIRNPLAGISGAIQILAAELSDDDPRAGILGQITQEIRRMDERINALLQFASTPRLDFLPARLREMCKQTLNLLDGHPGFETISITLKVPANLPFVALDAAQVQQVLINLMLNAQQAMGKGGRIRLSARILPGAQAEIAVEDSGPGIPVELAEKIFQPFFTTRPEGTGLGLAISQKIIESHGGSLEFDPGRGGGARFVIRLPMTQPIGSARALMR